VIKSASDFFPPFLTTLLTLAPLLFDYLSPTQWFPSTSITLIPILWHVKRLIFPNWYGFYGFHCFLLWLLIVLFWGGQGPMMPRLLSKCWASVLAMQAGTISNSEIKFATPLLCPFLSDLLYLSQSLPTFQSIVLPSPLAAKTSRFHFKIHLSWTQFPLQDTFSHSTETLSSTLFPTQWPSTTLFALSTPGDLLDLTRYSRSFWMKRPAG